MTVDEYNKSQLVRVAWQYAGKISFPACVAVLFCLRNQVEKNGDNDWLRVTAQYPLDGFIDARDPDFINVLNVVDSVYDNTRVDTISNDAVYFDGRGERCAVIGTLILGK